MKMFFIKKDKLIKLLLITLIIMNFFPWSIITLWCLGLIIYFYTLRRNRINYKEVINIQPDVMLSPVDGVVKEIIPNINDEFHNVIGTKIRFAQGWFDPCGIYLPMACQIRNTEHYDGEYFIRNRESLKFTHGFYRNNITLKNKANKKSYIELVKCPFGRKPKLWVEAGDKGKLASCIGFVPLGGTVVMTVPNDSEIFCKVGDRVRAGETVISGMRD
tara:strand:- start:31817 stop:32467 length:651 start_codon:yes stop_codon:yes gene_type:complete